MFLPMSFIPLLHPQEEVEFVKGVRYIAIRKNEICL